jgi:hypothetical protein
MGFDWDFCSARTQRGVLALQVAAAAVSHSEAENRGAWFMQGFMQLKKAKKK